MENVAWAPEFRYAGPRGGLRGHRINNQPPGARPQGGNSNEQETTRMSKPLFIALVAVAGFSTLAGCSHFHRDPAPVYTPVAEAPPPPPEPTYRGKYR